MSLHMLLYNQYGLKYIQFVDHYEEILSFLVYATWLNICYGLSTRKLEDVQLILIGAI